MPPRMRGNFAVIPAALCSCSQGEMRHDQIQKCECQDLPITRKNLLAVKQKLHAQSLHKRLLWELIVKSYQLKQLLDMVRSSDAISEDYRVEVLICERQTSEMFESYKGT